LNKNANIFAKFFGEKLQKFTTSVPGETSLYRPSEGKPSRQTAAAILISVQNLLDALK
jgi:hypothetical protein